MAESVVRHKPGLVFHKDEMITGQVQRLSSLISRVHEDPIFRRTSQRHAHLMRIRGGCARAATVIESIAYSGADFEEMWQGSPKSVDAEENFAPTLLQRRAQGVDASPPKIEQYSSPRTGRKKREA